MHNLYKCMQMLCSLPWKGPEGNSLGIRSPSAAEWAVIIVERNSTQQGRREERAGRGSCPGSARGSSGPSRGSSRSRELFAAVPVPGMNTDQLPASEPRLAGGEKRTCTEPVPHPARAAGAGARLGGHAGPRLSCLCRGLCAQDGGGFGVPSLRRAAAFCLISRPFITAMRTAQAIRWDLHFGEAPLRGTGGPCPAPPFPTVGSEGGEEDPGDSAGRRPCQERMHVGHSVSSGSCTRGGHGACRCPASTWGHSGSLGGSPASGLAVSSLAPLPAEGLPAWVQATPPGPPTCGTDFSPAMRVAPGQQRCLSRSPSLPRRARCRHQAVVTSTTFLQWDGDGIMRAVPPAGP